MSSRKYLLRTNLPATRHFRHTCSRLQRPFDDPRLLFCGPAPTTSRSGQQLNSTEATLRVVINVTHSTARSLLRQAKHASLHTSWKWGPGAPLTVFPARRTFLSRCSMQRRVRRCASRRILLLILVHWWRCTAPPESRHEGVPEAGNRISDQKSRRSPCNAVAAKSTGRAISSTSSIRPRRWRNAGSAELRRSAVVSPSGSAQ